jgi:choline dehydrogenase-like flavoprotein
VLWRPSDRRGRAARKGRGRAAEGRLSPAEVRVLAAFAEAMAPGAHGLPAAERDVAVAGRIAELAPGMPARQLSLIRLGIRTFDRLFPPRRFSRSSLERRTVILRRLAKARSPLHRELLMLLKALTTMNYARDERVRAVSGFEARCETAGAPPPPSRLGELAPPEGGEECDVAIVGSGAGGAAAAAVLAEAGLDVVVIEAGPHLDRESYPADPIAATARMYRDAGMTFAEGTPPLPVPTGRVVGGTTVINSGTCFRTPPAILSAWREEAGIPWTGELEPHFEEAERMLAVQRPPAERLGRNAGLVAAGAGALRLASEPLARNAGDCVQCSSCPAGCRLDAKRGMHVSYLPRAVAAGARVRSGVEAHRITTESGRARGVECTLTPAAGETRPWLLRARRAVICAGGSFGTPELLLRSGLGGPGVGRGLRLHPSTWVGARFPEPVRGWEGIMQSTGVDAWQDRGLMLEATFTPLAFSAHWLPGVGEEHQRRIAEFDRIASNGVQMRDLRSQGRVALDRAGRLRVRYRLDRGEARTIHFGMARAAEIWFAAGADEVYPQVSGNPVLRPGDLARFESRAPAARSLRLEAFHPMGSVRIGPEVGGHPLDAEGRVRGTRDLLVADASVFPSSLGVNPMVTVIAVAGRLAERLAARLS